MNASGMLTSSIFICHRGLPFLLLEKIVTIHDLFFAITVRQLKKKKIKKKKN